MEPSDYSSTRLCTRVVYMSMLATTFFTLCDARPLAQFLNLGGPKIPGSSISTSMKNLKVSNHAKIDPLLDIHSYAEFYSTVSTSSALPPFESLAPLPSPPLAPQSPSTTIPPPKSYSLPLPPPPEATNFPFESPPPSPPSYIFSPPMSSPLPKYMPRPPNSIPSPPQYWPSPPKHVPSPPIYQPPIVYPPPSTSSPPPHRQPKSAVWCVSKPTVPDSIIQAAMDYACGSGADCKSIQPNEPCFQPNTLFAHASYAFNSYWQNTKEGGGTCDFGGTAMLVTVDPSFDHCNFIYT